MANFKLVPKMENNITAIYIVLPSGRIVDLCWIRFPDDKQVSDNVAAVNEIMNILRKRIRRSL